MNREQLPHISKCCGAEIKLWEGYATCEECKCFCKWKDRQKEEIREIVMEVLEEYEGKYIVGAKEKKLLADMFDKLEKANSWPKIRGLI